MDALIVNSTIADNRAEYGGGIWTWNSVVIVNSTISGNTAKTGGGILVRWSAKVRLFNSTVTGNMVTREDSQPGHVAGIHIIPHGFGGQAYIQNSIIAGNGRDDDTFDICHRLPRPHDINRLQPLRPGHRLRTWPHRPHHPTRDTDTVLGPLADNGPATGSGRRPSPTLYRPAAPPSTLATPLAAPTMTMATQTRPTCRSPPTSAATLARQTAMAMASPAATSARTKFNQ